MFHNTKNYDIFCRYYAAFRDAAGDRQEIEISAEVYEEFQTFKKAEKKLQNFRERHEEYATVAEEQLVHRAATIPKSVEELICERELSDKLYAAIDTLPELQRRRFLLYCKYELTYAQIAEVDGCTKRAVKFSVDIALKKLKTFF